MQRLEQVLSTNKVEPTHNQVTKGVYSSNQGCSWLEFLGLFHHMMVVPLMFLVEGYAQNLTFCLY